MIVGHIGGAGAPYEIQKSMRFRASASAYLSRTPTVSGNRKTWTWSGWIKRGALGFANDILSAGVAGGPYNYVRLGFSADNCLEFMGYTDPEGLQWYLKTAQVFRDPSAHFHLQVHLDTANAIAADRVKVFIGGVRVTSFITGTFATTYPAQNAEGWLGSTSYPMNIGRFVGASNYLDGYLSEINFIDGQALDASYFGQVSAETGVWIPKKYTGTYGTNGFYLPFNDGSTLGNLTADRSGNGNNWTANNISLTAGSSYDWMVDTPTNNYAVLNTLNRWTAATSVSEANLRTVLSSGATVPADAPSSIQGTIGFSSGKWYWECVEVAGPGAALFGIVSDTYAANATRPYQTSTGYFYAQDGRKVTNNTFTSYAASWAINDVIGVALDLDAGTLTFYKNGVSQGVAFSGLTGGFVPSFTQADSSATHTQVANFGQRPFAYTPPTGFKSLCTQNLPAPVIPNPKKHFDVLTNTGANIKSALEALYSDQALMIVKDRANANNWQWFNDVTGLNAILQSNTTGAETTYSAPSGSSVGWLWKAGGAPVANNSGSIASQVSANPQAGFSIVTYTGTGANGTVGHGLGVAPKMVIIKQRNGTGNWPVYYNIPEASLGMGVRYLLLNTTDASIYEANIWQGSQADSSKFYIGSGTYNNINTNGGLHVAYCFAEIPGYSKIGSYTGNGSADGPFVWCGFKPAFVMIKRSDAGPSNWTIHDTAREAANVQQAVLYPHLSNAEAAQSALDVLSSGFKLRHSTAEQNGSGGTYIFVAFAEAPFKYANAR